MPLKKKNENIEISEDIVLENALNEERKETQQSFFFAKDQTKVVQNSKKFQGEGSSKKIAQQNAASNLIKTLKI